MPGKRSETPPWSCQFLPPKYFMTHRENRNWELSNQGPSKSEPHLPSPFIFPFQSFVIWTSQSRFFFFFNPSLMCFRIFWFCLFSCYSPQENCTAIAFQDSISTKASRKNLCQKPCWHTTGCNSPLLWPSFETFLDAWLLKFALLFK